MTEIVSNLANMIANQPFNDIVNHNLDKVNEDIQNKVVKSLNSIVFPKKQEQIEEKQNKIEDSSKPQDKTIKKQTNVQNLNLMSTKTIYKDLGFGSQSVFDNPEWDFLNNIQSEEISHVIRLEGEFNLLTTYFLQFSKKFKLSMCQQTDTFATVKKDAIGSCRCILKIWSNNDSDATVYQIRKFGRNNQRVKLILVEGQQVPFHRFFMRFLSFLEEKKLVKILPGERVQLIFDKQCEKTLEYQKICNNIMKRLNKQKSVKIQQIELLTVNIQAEALRLVQVLTRIPNLTDMATLQRQIQDLCFHTSGILEVYDKLNQHDYEEYRRKRETILKKHNFAQLFQQLQISEHFQQFKKLRSLKQIELSEQKIPYMASIKQLKRFATLTSSSAALQSIIVFHQKIRVSYQKYCKNTSKAGDMDQYLPITIFCVLAVDCQTNFLGLVKFLLAQLAYSDEAEWQKKTLTDLQAAFEYILRQWEQQK